MNRLLTFVLLLASCTMAEATPFYDAGGGGGGGTLVGDVWSGDTPEATPHAKSDDFTAGALDGKWTEWDSGSRLTAPVPDDGITFKYTAGSTAHAMSGIAQPAPSDNYFSVTAKVLFSGQNGNYEFAGVFVGEDVITSPTTTGIAMVGPGSWSNAPYVISHTWNAYNSFGIQQLLLARQGFPYFRIFVDRVGGTIHYFASLTGEEGSWVAWSTFTIGGAVSSVDTIGVGIDTNVVGDYMARVRNFEVIVHADASVASMQAAHGDLISIE